MDFIHQRKKKEKRKEKSFQLIIWLCEFIKAKAYNMSKFCVGVQLMSPTQQFYITNLN
jgi:hypothetical protein